MAGQIRRLLDAVIEQRAKGNETVGNLTKTKLILKGLDPDRYNAATPDDPAVISKVRAVAIEMGVHV